MKFKIKEFADGSAIVYVTYDDRKWNHVNDFTSYSKAKVFVMQQLPPETIVREVHITLD